MKAITSFALALVACKYPELPQLSGDANGSEGTSDGQGTDSSPGIDAMPDAARTCYVMADLGSLTLGSSGVPVAANWFSVPNSGPNAGKTIFTIAANLPGQTPATLLTIEVAKPAIGFGTGMAYPFTTTPNTAYVAESYLLGDYNQSSGTHQQRLFSSSGSVTFTAIGEASSSNINGSVAMTTYREIDETTNATVPGGCMSLLQSIQFYLRQN